MSTLAPTLSKRYFPRTAAWLRDLSLITLGALFVAVLAQIRIPLPFTPVPLTGQTFGVLLVGAALGARRGLASLGLYTVARTGWSAGLQRLDLGPGASSRPDRGIFARLSGSGLDRRSPGGARPGTQPAHLAAALRDRDAGHLLVRHRLAGPAARLGASASPGRAAVPDRGPAQITGGGAAPAGHLEFHQIT